VLKEFRGQGLGPAVTEKLKQQLFDRGYEAVGIGFIKIIKGL
jgi:ribosomal protein S18 acetylase RimI-like enzyme